jgi:hypothetical protein
LAWGVGAEGRAAVADYAKQVPGAVVESVKALGGVAQEGLDALGRPLYNAFDREDQQTLDYIAENPKEAVTRTAAGLWDFMKEGTIDFAKDFGTAMKEGPGALVEGFKQMPEAAKAALGGLFIEVPRGIVEKIKGDKALDAIAKELEADDKKAKEALTDYSPEAIRRREEAESQAAFEALFEEVPMTEQMTDFLKKLTNGGVEVISNAPRGAWEMAKFINNDLFVPTVKGNAEALKYLTNSLTSSAGELYRGGKESAGKRMEQAADLVKSASGWVENAVKYMKENKIQLNKETTRANDKYQNRLAELRIANAKNVLSEPELTSRRIEQLNQQGVKEGLTPEAAAARANKDAASMLEQAGLSAERIQQTFEAVKALEALESQVPDVTEFMEEDEEMAA